MQSQYQIENRLKSFFILILLLFLSIITIHPTYAQSKFEGEVTFSIKTQDGQSHTMNYYVKGDHARINVAMPGTPAALRPTIIFDSKTKMMYTLITQMKSYMEIPLDSLTNKAETKYDNMLKPHKTGKTKMIAGVKCEEWTFKDNNEQTILWNAPNFGNFVFATGASQPAWAKEIMKRGFFPFEIVNHDENGNSVVSLEVTKVTRKNLDPSMFVIPAGYTKMNVPFMQH